jgi:hypothetical protein
MFRVEQPILDIPTDAHKLSGVDPHLESAETSINRSAFCGPSQLSLD